MSGITKNNLLNHFSGSFEKETIINTARIFNFNDNPVFFGEIIYLCERAIRAKDNFALQFALQKSQELNLPLKIIHPKQFYNHPKKQNFVDKQLYLAQKNFLSANLNFEIFDPNKILNILTTNKVAMLIMEFNPRLDRNFLNHLPFKIYEIDTSNIIPARYVSNKQEYGAHSLRQKIYSNLETFLTEFDNITQFKTEADFALDAFLKKNLHFYCEFKNDPAKNVVSDLFKYLNLGFLSAQRVAIEVIKSDAQNKNKEAFLEELIIRRELSDNFYLYAKNFKDFSSVPNWANFSIMYHKNNLRLRTYSKKV